MVFYDIYYDYFTFIIIKSKSNAEIVNVFSTINFLSSSIKPNKQAQLILEYLFR